MSKADELQFVRVETVGGRAETFAQVPPFAVRLGNVVRGIGTFAMSIGVLIAATCGVILVFRVITGTWNWQVHGELSRSVAMALVLPLVVFYLPSRVIDYLLTGRK